MIAIERKRPRAVLAGWNNTIVHLGGRACLLVTGEETDGRFALLESWQQRGAEPPRHTHTREDVLVYVLEGRVTYYVDGKPLDVPQGTSVHLPRYSERVFRVETGEARMLVMVAPAGPEDYLREMYTASAYADPTTEIDRMATTAARYGIAITGPRP